MSGKDIARYAKMLSFFQKIAGDRPVGAYQYSDIKNYASLLQRLPARAFLRKMFGWMALVF